MTENILPLTGDEDRKHLCLEGVHELDIIARTLPDLVEAKEDGEHLIIRALAGRMLRLTSMLMSALGDDAVTTKELNRHIHFGNGQG